jgi:hypothetical protein
VITCSSINDNSSGLLGNKLFIIAAMIALAKKHNDEVILPGEPNWLYGDIFENKIKTTKVLPDIKYVYKEPFYHYKEIEYKKDMDVIGFFQSEKYFIDAIMEVRHFFEPAEIIKRYLKKRYPMIWNELCISIHIRRNDYLYYQNIHPQCSNEYYMNAMEILEQPDRYIIFSDDIKWCRETFQCDNSDIVFVENQSNYEDLFLMSFCKHHIVANSTFSWWGSYLNKDKEKQIIMPKKWFGFGGPQDWQDIYPTGNVKTI